MATIDWIGTAEHDIDSALQTGECGSLEELCDHWRLLAMQERELRLASERQIEWHGRLLHQAYAQSGCLESFASWMASLSLNTTWGDERDEAVWGRMPDDSPPRVSETPPLSAYTAGVERHPHRPPGLERRVGAPQTTPRNWSRSTDGCTGPWGPGHPEPEVKP